MSLLEIIAVAQICNLAGFAVMFWFARDDARARLGLLEALRTEIVTHANVPFRREYHCKKDCDQP